MRSKAGSTPSDRSGSSENDFRPSAIGSSSSTTFGMRLSFHDTQFTGLDLPSNLEETRRAAKAALNLYRSVGLGRRLGAGPLAGEPVRPRAGRGRRRLL